MPQQLDRDPNALSTLLRGQTQIPRYTEEEESLQSMIPEEQLYQMQDAQADAGRARGGPYSVSSRDSLRESGVAGLRQMLGLQRAEGQAKAYPNQVAGEYNLGRERIRAGGNVEAARVRAEADATNRTSSQQFQQENQGRQQEFQGNQNSLNRAAVERNTQSNIQGRASTAAANQAAIGERQNPSGGALDYIKSLFGMGGEEAAAPAATAPTGNVAQAVESFRQHPSTANATFQQLMEAGEFDGATPQEIAEFQQAWGR